MDFNNSKMKTSLLILISLITITAHSQNNLFFDEVKLIRFSIQPSVTVPSGKVWKIVGADLEGTNESVNININGQPFFLSGVNTGVNNQIWLPEGTIVSGGSESSANGALMPTSTISVIQYAVIPISSGTSGSTASTGGFTSTTDFVGSGQYSTTNDYTLADSFTDIDGNEYGAVNVLGTVWATSNLKVTKFTDGTPIQVVADSSEMSVTMGPACMISSSGEVYYNWFAINESNGKKLAPEGYRITSVSDWQRLIDFYGGGLNAAHFMKGRTGWNTYYGGNGLDKSGINLIPNSVVGRNAFDAGSNSWGTRNLGNPGYSNFGEFFVATIQYNSASIYSSEILYISASYKKRTQEDPNYNWTAAVAVRVVKDY